MCVRMGGRKPQRGHAMNTMLTIAELLAGEALVSPGVARVIASLERIPA